MSTGALSRHYEAKYLDDTDDRAIESYRRVPYPTNRYTACIATMHRHFAGGSILELGAGSGIIAKSLIETGLPFERYVLTDLAEVRVEGVRRKLADPRLSALRCDAETITSDVSGHYDAVLMVALIEHLIDPMRAMQGIRQILRPGGFVYVDTPNIAKYTRRLKLLAGRFPSTASMNEGLTTYQGAPADLYDEGHLHYFTFRSLRHMLTERCGFARVVPCPYFIGRPILGGALSCRLAHAFPGLFSEVALIAYA